MKASRRPAGKSQHSGRAPNTQNRGRGQWRGRGRGGFRGGRSMGSSGRTFGGGQCGRGSRSGGSSGSVNFDPLPCYRCGMHGHVVYDCPQVAQSQGSGNLVPSRGGFSKSGHKGSQRGRGRGRQVRFSGLNVLYDNEDNSYPIAESGQLYVPLDFGQTVAESAEAEMGKETKN